VTELSPGRSQRDALDWGGIDTPVGRISVGCGAAGIACAQYGSRPPPGQPQPGPGHSLLRAALAELAEYFGGQRKSFGVPVDLSGTSGARHAVLSALYDSVGYGETITYGGLAARAGLADAGPVPPARVVGQIMASNPVTIIVPCHRVVAGNGLGGYSGGVGTDTKQWLLIFEGALPPTLDWDPSGLHAAAAPGG
jgi:methylated-DNA-[protein]-cysteine S-methyltransferase